MEQSSVGYQQPTAYQPTQYSESSLPPQYKPLGAWAYFGYSLLFSIPLVGFILLIVFSFNSSNINRRNFARSYWCALVIILVIAAILVATGTAAGVLSSISRSY